MPKIEPNMPWPLSKEELEHEVAVAQFNLLQLHPERKKDIGNKSNHNKLMTSYTFYREQGFPVAEIGSHLMGINFDEEVKIITMPPPSTLSQWQIPALGTESPRVGCYWTIPDEQYTPRALAVNPEGPRYDPHLGRPSSHNMMRRTKYDFECLESSTPKMKVLKTIAAPIIDTWTDPNNPKCVIGGGVQYFSPALRDYYTFTNVKKLGHQRLRDVSNPKPSDLDKINNQIDDATIAIRALGQKLNSVLLARRSPPDAIGNRSPLPALGTLALEQKHQEAARAVRVINNLGDSPTLEQKKQIAELLFAFVAMEREINKSPEHLTTDFKKKLAEVTAEFSSNPTAKSPQLPPIAKRRNVR